MRIVPGAHDEHAAPVGREHGLFGVDDQVEQHLLYLLTVCEYVRKTRRERDDDGDVGDALLVGPQRQRFTHDLVHIHHGARRLPFSGEGEQAADDACGALGLTQNRLDAAADRRFKGRARKAVQPSSESSREDC